MDRTARPSSSPVLLLRLVSLAKRVVPPLALLVLAVWAARQALRRAQERQLRDFQTQLASFSSMLDLDNAARPNKGEKGAVLDSANLAKQVLETSSKRYKFRADAPSPDSDDDIESKVRLDLFRAAGSPNPGSPAQAPPADAGPDVAKVEIADVMPDSPFEATVAQCLSQVETGDQPAKEAAKAALNAARDAAGLSEAEAAALFDGYLSRVVSAQIDRAAVNLDSDDRESLRNLHQLTVTMGAAKALGPEAGLAYVGVHAGEEGTREELYRRYAVFCLSSEERVKDDLQSLVDMQTLLSVSDARAETINTEIAKGMFQVAVSAAMADGSLDDGSRQALETLKESFGGFLDGGSADSIMSEVAVMRAMYSLQQLLQEQGVSDDDVKELRKMCKELGVDIDEMLQNADALGDALGPEAKEFVESLRGLLSDSKGDEGMVSSVKPIDSSKDASPSPATDSSS